MSIKQWHGDKIILVWVVGAVVAALVCLSGGAASHYLGYSTLGTILVIFAPAAWFAGGVAMTWIWLSGRESRR